MFCLEKVIVCPVYATPVLVWIVQGARTESCWLQKGVSAGCKGNKGDGNGSEVKGVSILAHLVLPAQKKNKGQRHKRGREERRKTKKLNRCSEVVAIWVTALLPGNGHTIFCIKWAATDTMW